MLIVIQMRCNHYKKSVAVKFINGNAFYYLVLAVITSVLTSTSFSEISVNDFT